MSALRLARGFTGGKSSSSLPGCYHGHSDSMLVKAGSGALTNGNPDSAGVTRGAAQDTLLAQYNDLDSVEQLLESNRGQVAAVIVEPVGANMGVVPPAPGFLPGLRRLCDAHGALLIFDEVITGFRLALGGAMEYFGVEADLVTYGKIIGAGMPVGAYGGRREIMAPRLPFGQRLPGRHPFGQPGGHGGRHRQPDPAAGSPGDLHRHQPNGGSAGPGPAASPARLHRQPGGQPGVPLLHPGAL